VSRRALKNVRGPVRRAGDEALSGALAEAWERASREDPDTLTHGFHSWPARMHTALARALLARLDGRVVLDPFCGGGTVLVEARVAGRRAIGLDLNPLALRLSEVRCAAPPAAARERFLDAARAAAAASEARVRGRVPIQVKLSKREVAFYAPHVLKELGGLLVELRAVEEAADRRALELVFSSILIKVSRQRADTSDWVSERRIRKGLSTELFLRKAEELAERWAALEARVGGPMPYLVEGDALQLHRRLRSRRADLIVSSPPYGGTYDYASHHARRIAFLGFDDRKLRRFELGARRHLGRGPEGAERWEAQVDRMLGAMVSVLRPSGRIALVMGDAEVGGQRVRVPAQLARLAPRHGLGVEASASQARRDWRGKRPREEHLIVLKP